MSLSGHLAIAPKLVKNASTTVAAIAALTIVLRFILSSKTKKTLITDFRQLAKPITGRASEYDPDEYDVVIIGGGASWRSALFGT